MESQDPIALPELKERMARNGDAVSFPYWATQEVLWNGRRVLVQRPNPISQKDEE